MAWCDNENCRKDGLRKADIEFCEDTRKILCHGCYALVHPGWIPPAEYVDLTGSIPKVVRNVPEKPHVGFAIKVSDQDGITAQLSYGAATVTIQAPPQELLRLVRI